MADKPSAKGWTDNEKLGLMLQIMSKVSPIPWNELTLPEGRTVKACQVMIDKEKAKLKKAREEAGESTLELKATPKVRDFVAARMKSALNIEPSEQAAAAGKRKKADDGEKPVKKARKGKKSAEVEDEEGEEVVKKKGGKKGGKKAVKAEEDAPASASGSAEPEGEAGEQVKEEAPEEAEAEGEEAGY